MESGFPGHQANLGTPSESRPGKPPTLFTCDIAKTLTYGLRVELLSCLLVSIRKRLPYTAKEEQHQEEKDSRNPLSFN